MDKSLRQAYDYWQDQPDNSHECTSFPRKGSGSDAPGSGGNTAPRAPKGRPRGIRCFTPLGPRLVRDLVSKKLTNARVSQLSSYLTAAKRPGCFFEKSRAHATAVPKYRPQTTCEPAVPTATATGEPGKCVETPQDSICSTNPGWLETASGSPVLEALN